MLKEHDRWQGEVYFGKWSKWYCRDRSSNKMHTQLRQGQQTDKQKVEENKKEGKGINI